MHLSIGSKNLATNMFVQSGVMHGNRRKKHFVNGFTTLQKNETSIPAPYQASVSVTDATYKTSMETTPNDGIDQAPLSTSTVTIATH